MPASEPENRTARFAYALAFCLLYEEPERRVALQAWWGTGTPNSAPEEAALRATLQAARWALKAPDAPTPEERLADQPVALVAGGATKIKGYVFKMASLPEIRGASALLDRINLVDLPALWQELFSGGAPFEPNAHREAILYANGGELLAFAPPSQAPRLADAIECRYTQETLVAQSVAVYETFTLRQLREGLALEWNDAQDLATLALGYNPVAAKLGEGFGGLVTELTLAKFRRREANPDADRAPATRVLPHYETVPYARRCNSCDRRSAVVETPMAEQNAWLCEPCARKRIFGQHAKRDIGETNWWNDTGLYWDPLPAKRASGTEADQNAAFDWATQFATWLQQNPDLKETYYAETPVHQVKAARDLNEIASASQPESYIGVIYADGNNIGSLLEGLNTPSHYAEFAEALYEATKQAVFRALAKNLRPTKLSGDDGKERWIHPFEILSIGGDDLFLLAPAHNALALSCDIAEEVETYLLERHPVLFKAEARQTSEERAHRCRVEPGAQVDACRVSLSVGVALADAHTPVYYLENLAAGLLKSAKKRAKQLKQDRNYRGGTIDFLAIKSFPALTDTVDHFRSAALTTSGGDRLYARPYTIAETRALLESAQTLKCADFPATQLYRLRESLRQGRTQSLVDYLYFLSRSPAVRSARHRIEALWPQTKPGWHPWRATGADASSERYETLWLDLIELYPFVTKECKEEMSDADSDPD